MRSQSEHNIPDLPNTKDFHLFICYTSCDAAIVREIVKYLEAEGLKCCYNERDFPSGRKVLHNINDAIKRSMGIIIILSEESVNSSFCQHEIELAVHTSITDGYIIIPIMVEPCDIPEVLQTVTYIDAQNKESSEMHIMIINAFLQNVLHVEQERTNGLTRSIPLTSYKKGYLKRLSVWRYKLLVSQNERQSIRMKGFNVLDARFDEMQTIVSSSFHVKYKHIIDSFLLYTGLVFFMLSLLIVSLIFGYIAIFFGNKMDSTRSETTLVVLILIMVLSLPSWIASMTLILPNRKDTETELTTNKKGYVYTWKIKSEKNLNMKLWWRINKETIRADKYFVFFRAGVVCERRCRNLKSLTKFVTPGEGETDAEYTERLFGSYLKQNYNRLTVSSNVYGRHEMKNGASCLCTLLDNDISKQDQYQLT